MCLIIIPNLAKASDDVILKIGEKAPFYGVLVDSEHYREYSEGLQVEDFINKDKDSNLIEQQKGVSEGGKIVIGFLVGVVSGIALMVIK